MVSSGLLGLVAESVKFEGEGGQMKEGGADE